MFNGMVLCICLNITPEHLLRILLYNIIFYYNIVLILNRNTRHVKKTKDNYNNFKIISCFSLPKIIMVKLSDLSDIFQSCDIMSHTIVAKVVKNVKKHKFTRIWLIWSFLNVTYHENTQFWNYSKIGVFGRILWSPIWAWRDGLPEWALRGIHSVIWGLSRTTVPWGLPCPGQKEQNTVFRKLSTYNSIL
jgi:hypothetical protein